MKLFFVAASLLLAFTAQASDRKIGNVIAVEREIKDVYSTCLKNVTGDTTGSKFFFSCAIKYVTPGEIPVTKGRAFRLHDEHCSVNADFANSGVLFVTFSSAKDTSTYETSKACLQQALTNIASVKTLVYTLE